MKRFSLLPLVLFILCSFAFETNAKKSPKAPEWLISEWINGPSTSLQNLEGKVIIVEFFQLWCPGCNKFSIPLMKSWSHKFHKEIKSGDLKILSIHTVFEGHDYQTPERLRDFIKRKEIHHLVGIDLHKDGQHIPETMKRYNTMGTPEVAIIDRNGTIRFQRFGGFDTDKAEQLILNLLSTN